jgi:drug/metabolite transporter (DMT)-like permease
MVNARKGILLTVLAATLFATGGTVAIDLFQSVEPLHAAQLRSVGAALVMGAIALWRGESAHRGRLGLLLLLGVLVATVTTAYYHAIDRLGVGPGLTIQFTAPVLVLIWMRVVQRRQVAPLAWLAGVVAISGTGLITRVWEFDRLDPIGLTAAAAAAFTFAGYLLLSEYLARDLSAVTISAYGLAFSAILLLIITGVDLPSADPAPWLQLGWIVILGTVAPFLLEIIALRMADPGTVGVAASVEPLVGAGAAWVWLGQSLTLPQIVGAIFTVTGVAIIQRATARATP